MTDEIKCHVVSGPFTYGKPYWETRSQRGRLPEGVTCDEPDAPEPFRTCSHCGSMNPEDLVKALEAGASLEGSDWKYGWPHKFYVTGIPNPSPDTILLLGYSSGGRNPDGTPIRGIRDLKWDKAGPVRRGKFYNDHLLDLEPELFARVSKVLVEKSGIEFKIGDDGKLHYRAPHHNYQR